VEQIYISFGNPRESSWVEQEIAHIDIGDKRLNKRAKQLLERLIAQPTHSLPTACRGWTETQAAYRFFPK